ncbi:MAG: LytTR family DNA-binding domain-containing protein [Ruminococcus sp.]|nr:LytTR family DNA-binding domain-containing protein [Ruminococcus sp.]
MNIVICDDDESDILTAKNVIKQTVQELHIKTEFDYYLKATDVEKKLLIKKESTDILILDIDMPEVSGLELAEKLRAENKDLIIIFLSNHEEFVFKAIEFQPFRYIRKMHLNTEMPLAIRSAVRVIESNRDKQIIFNTEDGEMKVMISEIMYFEADKRKTIIHLSNGVNVVAGKSITEVFENIKSNKFIMIHRCCAVNADFIKSVKNDIAVLKNTEALIISRRKSKEVRQQIMKLWGDKI